MRKRVPMLLKDDPAIQWTDMVEMLQSGAHPSEAKDSTLKCAKERSETIVLDMEGGNYATARIPQWKKRLAVLEFLNSKCVGKKMGDIRLMESPAAIP